MDDKLVCLSPFFSLRGTMIWITEGERGRGSREKENSILNRTVLGNIAGMLTLQNHPNVTRQI